MSKGAVSRDDDGRVGPRAFGTTRRSRLGRLLTETRIKHGLSLSDLGVLVGAGEVAASKTCADLAVSLRMALRFGRALDLPDHQVAETWFLDHAEREGVDPEAWLQAAKTHKEGA